MTQTTFRAKVMSTSKTSAGLFGVDLAHCIGLLEPFLRGVILSLSISTLFTRANSISISVNDLTYSSPHLTLDMERKQFRVGIPCFSNQIDVPVHVFIFLATNILIAETRTLSSCQIPNFRAS